MDKTSSKQYRIINGCIVAAMVLFCLLTAWHLFNPYRRATEAKEVALGSYVTRDYMLSSLNVTSISQDTGKRIWIGSSAGINVYDGQNFVQFSHDAEDTLRALPDDYINVIHRDRKGRMWIGTQNGLACYRGGNTFDNFPLPTQNMNVTAITDSPTADEVDIVCGEQHFRVNHSRKSVTHSRGTTVVSASHDTLPNNFNTDLLEKPQELVSCVFRDVDSNLWIGYHNAGYQVISSNTESYFLANDNALAKATDGMDVTFMETVGQHILAGTTRRLFIYDTTTGRADYTYYEDLFRSPQGEREELIDMVGLDDQRVWVVSKRKVTCCHLSGSGLHTEAQTTANCRLGTAVRSGNDLYISASGGALLRCDFQGNIRKIPIASRWYDEETQLEVLRDGRILLFMKDMETAIYSPLTGHTSVLNTGAAWHHLNIDPAFAFQDSRGTVWLGTKRYGLYRMNLRDQHIEKTDFLNDVHIQAMAEDDKHQLWITTLKDATCYQPDKGAVLMNSLVSSSQNNWNRQFFDRSICIAPGGNVVFGSSDGCIFLPANRFNEQSIDRSLFIYDLIIRKPDGETRCLNEPLSAGASYTFDADENDLTFNFFYPNFSRKASLMYQYRLEGYDRKWRKATYKHEAHFANIQPGHYTFRVKLVSSPNQPPLAEQSVDITIRRAYHNSAAAWVLYLGAVACLLTFIVSLYLRSRTNRMLLEQEQHEREREQRTNEMNMNFFANISHEFRNPITIIAGPLLSLKTDTALPPRVRNTLNGVCVSVNRMLRLIDQMLDFNQLETDALRLKVAQTDAAEEIRKMMVAFEGATKVKGIRLETFFSAGQMPAWLDTDKLEKVVSNLFTNALKHTATGGIIRISVQTNDERLVVSIYNSGAHIRPDRLADVFKRYYQISETEGSHHYGWGTGIGLYYVKRLIGLHHGDIYVHNVEEELPGVEFRFSLPIDRATYRQDETVKERHTTMQIPIDHLAAIDEPAVQDTEGKERKKILIVDDDMDVAQYVRSIFADHYQVEIRYSAEEALADLAAIAPDIILSDIIMGDLSGYDFCRRVKADLMFSHIPFVMITAKSNMDEQISGLRLGAVAYVTKPFDPDYLKAIVEAQLTNITLLRQRLGDSTATTAVADQLSEQDRQFMDELYAIMEKRGSEMELNVSTVCHDLLISPTKFNYKVKQLTGETPGSFFRRYKLNRAAILLKEGKHNVSEIALLTGFSTAAHFSVAFKKQFGVSPSEFHLK